LPYQPPVSDPSEPGHASGDRDGTSSRRTAWRPSVLDLTGKKALFSVDDPIANSSMLHLLARSRLRFLSRDDRRVERRVPCASLALQDPEARRGTPWCRRVFQSRWAPRLACRAIPARPSSVDQRLLERPSAEMARKRRGAGSWFRSHRCSRAISSAVTSLGDGVCDPGDGAVEPAGSCSLAVNRRRRHRSCRRRGASATACRGEARSRLSSRRARLLT
jgi:hypothetical protein